MNPKPSAKLTTPSFLLFSATQYLGAFNDNIFKQLVLLRALVLTSQDRQGVAMMVFSLPFLLFSGYAGQLSEKLSKTSVMRLAKLAELSIMFLGTLGFFLDHTSLLMITLFLMGTQSAFFGPSKYGVIPELVATRALVAANGVVQMTTMAAIILGAAIAGYLMELFTAQLYLAGVVCMFVSAAGIVTVYGIQPLRANRPGLHIRANPLGRIWECLLTMYHDRALFMALIAYSFFYFSGGLVTQVINNYGIKLLELGPRGTSMLLVILTSGIMAGCLVTASVKNRLGAKWTVFVGAVGVIVAEFLLTFYQMPLNMIRLALFMAGFFTGLYFVPIAAFLQAKPPLGQKGEILAAVNFSSFVGILLSGAVWQGLVWLGISANLAWLFLAGGLVLMLIALYPRLHLLE